MLLSSAVSSPGVQTVGCIPADHARATGLAKVKRGALPRVTMCEKSKGRAHGCKKKRAALKNLRRSVSSDAQARRSETLGLGRLSSFLHCLRKFLDPNRKGGDSVGIPSGPMVVGRVGRGG
jgi:hypothetical protein